MQKEIKIVVGDIFKNMSNNKSVTTFSQIIDQILSGNLNYVQLNLEQGVSEHQYQTLQKLITKLELTNSISLNSYYDSAIRCPNTFTHKVKAINTLISEPIQINQKKYYSSLMINEACAELSDHVTGQHLQGMLLMEAARQMTLAVTEKFFIDKDMRSKVSFISNSSEIKFYAYAFPISTKIDYEIIKKRGLFNHNSEYTVTISFIQNHQIVADVLYKFSVMDKSFIKTKENSAIKDIITKIANSTHGKENEHTIA